MPLTSINDQIRRISLKLEIDSFLSQVQRKILLIEITELVEKKRRLEIAYKMDTDYNFSLTGSKVEDV